MNASQAPDRHTAKQPSGRVIEPTPARMVWYHPRSGDPLISQYVNGKPFAAIISDVNDIRSVNLLVIAPDATTHPRLSVVLRQPDDDQPALSHCCWMPYQVGQAEKNRDIPDASKIASEPKYEGQGSGPGPVSSPRKS